MTDYIAQSETEYLVLIDPVLPPVCMEVQQGANVATRRTIETYALAEQAETRMRELVPGWEPLAAFAPEIVTDPTLVVIEESE